MSALFSDPWFLLLAALGLLGLIGARRERDPSAVRTRFRPSRGTLLRGAAFGCLLLAGAGLRIPAGQQKIQVVLLADVSESILDRSAQAAQAAELLAALNPAATEAAVAAFGANAGTERRMSPLPFFGAMPENIPSRRGHTPESPNLQHLQTAIDPSATDAAHALNFARTLFSEGETLSGRGILLLSDFRQTRGDAANTAAALASGGIDLLAAPVRQGGAHDVYVASFSAPDVQHIGRAVPLEITIAGVQPGPVRVSVSRRRAGQDPVWIDSKTVQLETGSLPGAELRRTVRILDPQPDTPGVTVYTASITAPEGHWTGDILTNNELSAAVKIVAPSEWAVLTRKGSTLDALCAQNGQPLGVKTRVFYTGALPARASAYQACTGILVDGLSADELKEGVRALAEAAESGKGLVAAGGERAFGAGGHREGPWEDLLPVQMTPEDDRARSILFVIDCSSSMKDRIGNVFKIDFAREQIAQAIGRLKPSDRLGLVTFASSAKLAVPLSGESGRAAFLSAVQQVQLESRTNIRAALQQAAAALKADDADEQLVVLLTDGVDTAGTPPEEIVAAARSLSASPAPGAPRRTTVFTFGIGTASETGSEEGQRLLTAVAEAGGGIYSPDFARLAERLETTFDAGKKDFFFRREAFQLQARCEHPLLQTRANWPELSCRNRLKAKPRAQVLLASLPLASNTGKNRPDPMLVLSGDAWPGMGRCAVLPVALDGADGARFWAAEGTRTLLPALLAWAEARPADTPGTAVFLDVSDGEYLHAEVRMTDPQTHLPVNEAGLRVQVTALLKPASEPVIAALKPSAPGRYTARVPVTALSTYRASVFSPTALIAERLLCTPCSQELRRFGADRAAMQSWVAHASPSSRVIERPQDLADWESSRSVTGGSYALRPWLLVLGLLLLLCEFNSRGRRAGI